MSSGLPKERRGRVRRLSDVRPPTRGDARPELEHRADTGGTRRARLLPALASLVVLTLAVAGGFAIFASSADGAELVASDVALAGLLTLVLWLSVLPVALHIGRILARSPRRGRSRIVHAIERGIDAGEFELVYAPQINLDTGGPLNFEAMLRWNRRGETIAPNRFLPDAETGPVIGPLTAHVLDLAIAQTSQWRRQGQEIALAINLSAANLRDFSLVRHAEALLLEHDVPAGTITLEVTETAVLDEPEQARAVLDGFAALGFRISVDDFGTGYSSLIWLRLFPVDEVKIDRTFVSQMHAEGEAFVAGVIRLGHDLGLRVVAEGVEDERTLRRLQELHCDVGQGHLFAKPLAGDEVAAWAAEIGAAAPWAPRRKEMAIASDERDLDKARELIGETATEYGFDEAAIWDMKLAATEALLNAIEHGSPSEDGMVHMRLAQEHGDMLLEVWGGGGGETARAAPGSDRGRGIAIMSALMDEVELRRNTDDSRIRLAKRGDAERTAR